MDCDSSHVDPTPRCGGNVTRIMGTVKWGSTPELTPQRYVEWIDSSFARKIGRWYPFAFFAILVGKKVVEIGADSHVSGPQESIAIVPASIQRLVVEKTRLELWKRSDGARPRS